MRHIAFYASILTFHCLTAQTSVTVSTGPGNLTQTYYSLQNGVQGSAPLNEWDLAFEITGFSSSIRVNTAKGYSVYQASTVVTEWNSVNTPDVANWTLIHNSETDWSVGALNHGNNLSEPDGFNVGWGLYNIITHTITGNKIYVIEDGSGYYRKLRINSLLTGSYSFTYADLDGSNEHQGVVNKSAFADRNFAYWSMTTHEAIDLEPATGTWDLVFTKYIGFVPDAYGLTGVLQNKGIEALQVDDVPTDLADPWSAPYSVEINTIGADWKTFNMTTFEYEYVQDRTYFVKDRQGSIWKLIFTGYGGAANGDITFTQELVSLTDIGEIGAGSTLTIFPNPIVDGSLNAVMEGMPGISTISIFDVQGRTVHQGSLSNGSGMGPHSVDVSTLSNGVYMLQVRGSGSMSSARFVVQR